MRFKNQKDITIHDSLWESIALLWLVFSSLLAGAVVLWSLHIGRTWHVHTAVGGLGVPQETAQHNLQHFPFVQSLVGSAHHDQPLLLGNVSQAVLTVRHGEEAHSLGANGRALQQQTLKDFGYIRKLLVQTNGKFLESAAAVEAPERSIPRAFKIEVDGEEEDGSAKHVFCCYHILPIFGRLANTESFSRMQPQVVVTVSLFAPPEGFDHKGNLQIREGLLQMVEMLPHMNGRLNTNLAVFHDGSVPERFLEVLRKPHVTLVPVSKTRRMMSRWSWHDPAVLRKAALPLLGLTELPDFVMSYDCDEVLDSPAFDWKILHMLNRPEYMFLSAVHGGEKGPNGIARAFDGASWVIAPKRIPSGFRWPTTAQGQGLKGFMEEYMADKIDSYGADQEALTVLLETLVARDGTAGIYVHDHHTGGTFMDIVDNTNDDGMYSGKGDELWDADIGEIRAHEASVKLASLRARIEQLQVARPLAEPLK